MINSTDYYSIPPIPPGPPPSLNYVHPSQIEIALLIVQPKKKMHSIPNTWTPASALMGILLLLFKEYSRHEFSQWELKYRHSNTTGSHTRLRHVRWSLPYRTCYHPDHLVMSSLLLLLSRIMSL